MSLWLIVLKRTEEMKPEKSKTVPCTYSLDILRVYGLYYARCANYSRILALAFSKQLIHLEKRIYHFRTGFAFPFIIPSRPMDVCVAELFFPLDD